MGKELDEKAKQPAATRQSLGLSKTSYRQKAEAGGCTHRQHFNDGSSALQAATRDALTRAGQPRKLAETWSELRSVSRKTRLNI